MSLSVQLGFLVEILPSRLVSRSTRDTLSDVSSWKAETRLIGREFLEGPETTPYIIAILHLRNSPLSKGPLSNIGTKYNFFPAMDAALEQAKINRVVLDLGIKVPNAVAYRRDIDQFMLDDPIAFNLFLLALRKLQGLPANYVLSYFQIAGIHGLPAKDWDGVRGPGSQFTAGGYCTHGMLTFPSWHRPYV
jgi:Common central domain of tyrosinase